MNSYVGMTMIKKEQKQDDYSYVAVNKAYFSHYQPTLEVHTC